jgi:hypothetical protein
MASFRVADVFCFSNCLTDRNAIMSHRWFIIYTAIAVDNGQHILNSLDSATVKGTYALIVAPLTGKIPDFALERTSHVLNIGYTIFRRVGCTPLFKWKIIPTLADDIFCVLRHSL